MWGVGGEQSHNRLTYKTDKYVSLLDSETDSVTSKPEFSQIHSSALSRLVRSPTHPSDYKTMKEARHSYKQGSRASYMSHAQSRSTQLN